MRRRRATYAAQQAAARREREDLAARLKEEIPELKTLELELEEKSDSALEVTHKRYIVVDHAPALFELPCCDHDCREGGHDLTHEMLRALRRGDEEFEGTDHCPGAIGNSSCGRELHFVAHATYAH